MRTIRTTIATMLMGLALAAFQFDAHAQTRGTSQTSRSSGTVTRQSSGSENRTSSGAVGRVASGSTSSSNRQSAAAAKTGTSVSRTPSTGSTSATKPSTTVRPTTGVQTRPSTGTQVRPTTGTQVRPTTGVQVKPTTGVQTRPSTGTQVKPSTGTQTRPSTGTQARPANGTKPRPESGTVRPSDNTRPIQVTRPVDRKPGGEANRPSVRPNDGKPHQQPGKPVQVRPDRKPDAHRVHPRERDFMHYSAPSYFWTGHNHYYGHRVRVLPTYAHRYIHYGVTYYCYNDIWYRPYGGYYVVCRPPFGTSLAANLIADMTWTAVRLSYYYTVANTYSQINENNQYIAEQNAIIAQNNAVIAKQNAMIAEGQQQASLAYSLATQLGLVQSYAAAGSDYYYQDGVFYVMDANGQYKVIVPPAGALVETLPEDFDLVTLADGNEYYKVDDTIYRVVVLDGKPYFEVLGQLY